MMERPTLEYAENCTLIHTYARKLEEYCDYLEAIVSKGDCVSHYEKKIEVLEKALDKACEELENLSYVKGLGQVGMCYKEWKEWLMKDE